MKDLQVKMELRRKRVSTSVDQHVKDLKKVTGAIEKAVCACCRAVLCYFMG